MVSFEAQGSHLEGVGFNCRAVARALVQYLDFNSGTGDVRAWMEALVCPQRQEA